MISIKSIIFTWTASTKIDLLVREFKKEVGWHGIVQRVNKDIFVVKDILVHPQMTRATLTDTNYDEYQKWLMSLPSGLISEIRLQGHSHANMPVFSSAIDDQHQKEVVSKFRNQDDFYLFTIHNRRRQRLGILYEQKHDTVVKEHAQLMNLFRTKSDFMTAKNLRDFCNDARRLVKDLPIGGIYGYNKV